MRKFGAVLSLAVLGGFLLRPGSVNAQAVTPIADQPAATLLLPYFEVALPKSATATTAKGLNTVFSINNASATAVLAHATIWSDLAVPVLQFNVYLTGYDVQTIDLRQVFGGHLPQTASAGQDPSDTISPKGTLSQDINFASCSAPNTEPLPRLELAPNVVTDLRSALTGQSSVALGGCAGLDHGDLVARGFVTIDTVNNCTQRVPGDVGYFAAGGTGDATNQNVLWGDYFYLDVKGKVGRASSLVHIRASAADPQTSTSGQYTFYGRYVNWTAVDNRQPLSTNFVTRFIAPGGPKASLFPTGTSLLVWRDSKIAQAAFSCVSTPSWYPLGQEGIVIFDEQEHPEVPMSVPLAPQPPASSTLPFPAAAQRVAVDGPTFPVSFASGWLYLNLNTTVVPAGAVPPEDPAAAQAWVTTVHDSKGRYSVGYRAIQLDSAETALHTHPGF